MVTRKQNNDTPPANDKMGLLERMMKLIGTYGIGRILSGLMILAIFGGMIIIFTNQKEIIRSIIQEENTKKEEIHSNNMELRVKTINPQIDNILLELLLDTGADRAYIIEMHNGSNNITGLPFIYGEMTYEKVLDKETGFIADEYEKMNLSKYPFMTKVFEDVCWNGTTKEMEVIDFKLSQRLDLNGVKYTYIMKLGGSSVDIGFIGISFINGMPDMAKPINGKMLTASQKVSILLDLSSNAVNNK